MMNNLSKLVDGKRYYNWYRGYTAVVYPYYDYETSHKLNYFIWTNAVSGSISLQKYKEEFNKHKVQENIHINVLMYLIISRQPTE